MLREQKKGAVFSGGLDARLLQPWHRELFDSIRIHLLENAAEILDGIPPRKRRCYTMIGFGDETLDKAEERLEQVYALGFFPFCQLYQDEKQKTYSADWRKLQRKWSRPAAYVAAHA